MANITLYGYWTAIGKTVAVFLGGLDCGNYTVQNDGSVIVPYGSDPDGLLTAAYLQSISSTTAYGILGIQLDVTINSILTRVVVPCVVGFNYTSQGETVRPATQEQTRSQTGGALGKKRRVAVAAMLLQGAIGGPQGLQFRSGTATTWRYTKLTDATLTTSLNSATLFNGVFVREPDNDYDFDGVVSWQMARPYPVTVCGLNSFVHTQDR